MKITIPKQKFEVYPEDLEGSFNHDDATQACISLGEDWRLPTRKELLEMGDFVEKLELQKDYYWSSTENNRFAWYYVFNYGYSEFVFKSKSYRVRPVRTIKS